MEAVIVTVTRWNDAAYEDDEQMLLLTKPMKAPFLLVSNCLLNVEVKHGTVLQQWSSGISYICYAHLIGHKYLALSMFAQVVVKRWVSGWDIYQ